MSASDPGSHPPKGDVGRQAVHALRGYVYQVYASALAWLRLKPGEHLYLEVAEDYAIACRDALRGVQVKDTAGGGKVTLQTEDVRKAIDTYVELVFANPDRSVSLSYLTTSEIGLEQRRDRRVPAGPALLYWRRAAIGADVAPLRDVLKNLELKPETHDFLLELDDDAFRARFLRRIHWLCGAPVLADLSADLDATLIELASAERQVTSGAARRLRPAVVEKVLITATDPPPRKLCKADLLDLIDQNTLVEIPIAELHRLQANQRDPMVAEEALLAPPVAAVAQGRSTAFQTLRQDVTELRSMLDQVEAALAAALETALEEDRMGRSGKLRTWLAETRDDDRQWGALTDETRARALRAQAVLALRDFDVPRAEGLLDDADRLSPQADRSARAMTLSVKGAIPEALELLSEPLTSREREIRAGLLIESGDLGSAALALESGFGEEVSSEILRLRAILAMLHGDRETALRFASSAVERGRAAFASVMTRGAIHFFCALTPGVPVQFGGRLTPVHPGLLADEASVRRNLDLALADFDRLIEGDRPETTEVETWRLGCLLLHPDLEEEADFACRQLLRRVQVDPVVVLWSWAFGRLHRLGKIKKSLGDAVRFGKGTETHLIAWATLCAGASRPDLGLAVIKKHQHRFPEARALIDSWRIRFGDASLGPSSPYDRAMRKALSGDYEALIERLADPQAQPAELAGGADFLASRSAWADLDRLRPAILRLATPRLLRLAAVAALQTENGAGCLEVIDAAKTALGALSPELIALRVRAHELLGQYQPVIEELRSIRRQAGSDKNVSGQLLEAYLRVGALSDFADEARRSMAAGELDPNQILNVATVMRRHDGELARQALRQAMEAGVDEKATERAFFLALELGLEDIQQKIVETSGNLLESRAVQSFQTVEELLGYMEERNEAYRIRFDEWLRGEIPAAAAMFGDIKGYARLFLAEPAERRNLLNETFPMLLLSGARRRAPPEIASDRPVLRLDLSALLIAARLDILDAVEARFALETPTSLPDALSELDEAFSDLDPQLAAAGRKAVSPDGPLHVVEELEPGWTALEGEEADRDFDPQTLRRLSEAAFAEGHLDRHQLETLQKLVDPESPQAAWGLQKPAEDVSPVFVGRVGLWRLVANGVLDQLARSTPIHVLRSEVDALLRDLRSTEADARVKATIRALRARVTNRLMTGGWTVAKLLPSQTHAPAPAHVRCLVEVLGKQERDPALIWIEDRAASHSPLEQAVCVTEILSFLRQSALVDEAFVRRRLRELMSVGYAYLPTRTLEVSRRLSSAPADGGGLVETPELSELRVWYAQESERLRWLDLSVRHDREGRVAGEARRALDIDLAYKALTDIWSQVGVDHDAARARSAWVWACLRQPAPFSPPEPEGDHVRRYVAIHLAHALTIPLSGELTSDPIARDAQAAFVDWFVQSVAAPLERADPQTFELFIEVTAGMVERVADLDGLDETGVDKELRAKLARRLTAIASWFLDLLPDSFVSRILEHGDLKRKLPRRTMMALTLPDDVTLALEAFATAAEGLLRSAKPKKVAVKLSDDRPAWIEARQVDGDFELSVLFGKRRFRIAEETCALVHPDQEARLAAVDRHFMEPAAAITREEFDAAMRLTSAAERFEEVKRLREADFFSRMRLVRSKVYQKERLAIADLSAPSIEAMTRFLIKVPTAAPELVSPQDVRDLADVVGARTAIERLASCPLDFSVEALTEVAALMREEERQADPEAIVTPLEAALRLRASLAVDAELELLKQTVADLLASCERNGALFVALARYGALDVCHRADWREIPPETQAAFIWCYADQALRALAPHFVDADGVTQIIVGQTRRTFRDIGAFDAMPRWARDMTAELTNDRLFLGVVSMLIDDGATGRDAGLLDPLRALVGGERENAWWAPSSALAPPPPAPDRIWPARDVAPRLIAVGWLPADHPFATRDHETIARLIMDVAPGDEALHLRSCMLSHVDVGRVEPETLARMRATLVEDPVAAGLEPQMVGSQMILSAWADVLAELDDDDAMGRVVSIFAGHCASRWPRRQARMREGQTEASAALNMVVDVALQHAIGLPRPRGDQLRVFAASLTAVARAWPDMRGDVASNLAGLADAAEAPDAVPLWRTAVRLRARRA
ncbi:hypothetical protein IHQ68_11160 [Chelatococcus sambhunathii]|uniref:Uncharacterized protein n=1 Tax=Chelatococcus sambhunathii TaxID=363953 RepID=A0ABU1DGC3_9HYPH|nr:hypothetical protein [Chelatococcus sambhunathii]MDR4307178.1 hypothetical protein [Chelatococcus sambhunathii]